jgi:hypothetical protein
VTPDHVGVKTDPNHRGQTRGMYSTCTLSDCGSPVRAAD